MALSSAALGSPHITSELKHLCQGVERLAQRHNVLGQPSRISTSRVYENSSSQSHSLDSLDLSVSGRTIIEKTLWYQEELLKKVGKVTEDTLGKCVFT